MHHVKIIKRHPLLKQIFDNLHHYFIICLYGGRDSGKTIAMAQLLVMLMCKSSVKIAVFRAEADQLRDSIRDKIIEVIHEWGLEYNCHSHLKKNRRILIRNQIILTINDPKTNEKIISIIRFDAVENNPEKLRGGYNEYDIMVFEEWSQFSARVMDIAFPTIERAKSGMPHILGTCNLETPNTWIYERIKLGGFKKANTQWEKIIEEDPTSNVYPYYAWSVEMLYETNPWLPEFAKKNIELMRRENYEEYLIIYRNQPRIMTDDIILRHNVYIADEPFFLEWDDGGNVRLFDKRYTVYYGMDFGYNHLFANVECVVDEEYGYSERLKKYTKGKIYITRVVAEEKLDPNYYVSRIQETMPEQIEHGKLTFADAARPDLISALAKGWNESQPILNVRSCYKWNKKQSRSQTSRGCVLDRAAFLQSYEVIINPHCQKKTGTEYYHCDDVWHQMTHYRYKKDRKTGRVLDEIEKIDDDVPDALAYGLQLLIQTAYGINLTGEQFDEVDNFDYLDDNYMTAI